MKAALTLRDQVDRLLGKYIALDQTADDLIDAYVSDVALKCPGIPPGVVRQCEFEIHARGYSRSLALERLRQKLESA